jgi:hypothetical protein
MAVRPAVGLVETAALEGYANVPEYLSQRAPARRALGKCIVFERLHDFEMFAAGFAGVLVGWHVKLPFH